MLNHHSTKQQASNKTQTVQFSRLTDFDTKISNFQIKDKRQLSRSKATALGDWDGKVLAADPDPQMIPNSHYWNAYCLGQYQRYLKKYGIKQVNEA